MVAGIDSSTQSCKVVVRDAATGELLRIGRAKHPDGNEIDPGREGTIALCRCGKSRLRPFCDGSHKVVRFRAPSAPEDGREPGSAPR